jgi:hypothetical protein
MHHELGGKKILIEAVEIYTIHNNRSQTAFLLLLTRDPLDAVGDSTRTTPPLVTLDLQGTPQLQVYWPCLALPCLT